MDRLLVEIANDGMVSVSPWREGNLTHDVGGEPAALALPLSAAELEDLRWYLEDYLRVPFGVYRDRGSQIADQLPGWGARLFEAVFGTSVARRAYSAMRAQGRPFELVIRSRAALALGQPWELMRDPASQIPMALDHVALTRSLPTDKPIETLTVAGSRLRVLMVISRPGGRGDVKYQMIARPLLPLLEKARGRVDLVVLRPPTLQRLEEVLRKAVRLGEPFHVVHFDGHGVFDTSVHGTGRLAFEKTDRGWADLVEVGRVAHVIADGEVPVVVLNACRSGQIGAQVEATVATRMLQDGIASVVAMAYTVYPVAAAEFMAAFYERLFAGDRIADAVSAARRHLAVANRRPSSKGPLPLVDWLVPVHYTRGDVRFPRLHVDQPRPEPSAVRSARSAGSRAGEVAADGRDLLAVGPFVGRDGLLRTLEIDTSLRKVVVLYGPAGIGKTELAKGFGRWWRDTGGVDHPEWVVWHSFEPGVSSYSLSDVIDTIGAQIHGPDFASMKSPDERQAEVLDMLRERRLLLIWDNFESVHSMPSPDAVTPPLSEMDRAEYIAFLSNVRAGYASSVVITSRTGEEWLGAVQRIELGGLAPEESADFADKLLEPFPHITARREHAASFGELMQWLDGHPLSIRLIIPQLSSTDPEQLLLGLRGARPLPGQDGEGRTTSLAASIDYSYMHLAAADQRVLISLALFQGVADAGVLGRFSRAPQVPPQFRGRTTGDWIQVLNRATAVGLLTPLGGNMYHIHPALPAYLIRKWRSAEAAAFDQQYDAATQALLLAYSSLAESLDQEIEEGISRQAIGIVEAQRRTLGVLLGYSLDRQLWEPALAIVQPLNQYWDICGLPEEARRWAERTRLALKACGDDMRDVATPAGRLWLSLAGGEANRKINARQLDDAEAICQNILRQLQQQPEAPDHLQRLAVVYHSLGRVAQYGGHFDQAEDWCRRSLASREALGDQPGVAKVCHQLAVIAQERRQLDQAESWYRRSAAIMDNLGNRHGLALSFFGLGRLAQSRRELDQAETWYHQALDIVVSVGDRPRAATGYYQLGRIAQERGRWDDAETRYGQSLALREELGDRPGVAASYHQLGIVAQERGQLDRAESWYDRSLEIFQEIGDQIAVVACFGQRGLLAERRGNLQQALEWTIKCLTVFDQFPHPATGEGPQHLQRLTTVLGADALDLTWVNVTGRPVPLEVRKFAAES